MSDDLHSLIDLEVENDLFELMKLYFQIKQFVEKIKLNEKLNADFKSAFYFYVLFSFNRYYSVLGRVRYYNRFREKWGLSLRVTVTSVLFTLRQNKNKRLHVHCFRTTQF